MHSPVEPPSYNKIFPQPRLTISPPPDYELFAGVHQHRTVRLVCPREWNKKDLKTGLLLGTILLASYTLAISSFIAVGILGNNKPNSTFFNNVTHH